MIYLFLADGFEEIEAFSVVDILRRADIEILTISISNTLIVTGAHNICVKADKLFSEIESKTDHLEAIILPGGMLGTLNLSNHEGLKKLILKMNDNNSFIMAICAAPSILGNYGILKNKKVTCYPGYENKLIDADVINDDVVVDGNIITSRSAGTAIDFSLKIVEVLKGKDKSDDLKVNMIIH